MSLQQLKYLDALARYGNFRRAAEACSVTQPTLSAGIRALEKDLGALLVQRSNQFGGLTNEGEQVLAWAQRMLYEWDALRHNLMAVRTRLSGRLRLGAIPTALPPVSAITNELCRQHPDVSVTVLSMTSNQIQEALAHFRLDVGLTYLDNEPLPDLETLPLYRERYVLLTPHDSPFAGRASITWAEAATLPLTLLTGDMQNRRIVDAAFREAGVQPSARVDTNSIITLCAHIQPGGWSSILPAALLSTIAQPRAATAVPIVAPDRRPLIGLAALHSDPVPPLIAAVWSCGRQIMPAALTGDPAETGV